MSPNKQISARLLRRPVTSHLITYNHLLVLANANTLSLDDLDILQTTENIMLDLELGRHPEPGAFLDLERMVFEGQLGALGGEVNGDRWAAFAVHCQGQDDADAGVVGVRYCGTAGQS
jgi:hypothetical protein